MSHYLWVTMPQQLPQAHCNTKTHPVLVAQQQKRQTLLQTHNQAGQHTSDTEGWK